MPGARRILDNPAPDGRLLITDFELVEVRGAVELPLLELMAYSHAVALVGQEVAVVVIEEGSGAGGSFRLDDAPSRVMLEGVLLTGTQDIGLVDVSCAHFRLYECPT